MKYWTLQTPKNRKSGRLMPFATNTVVALLLLACFVSGTMATGDPDTEPTRPSDDSVEFGIWDIFDKKEIIQAAKDAWTGGLADSCGNLLLGIGVVIAFGSILLGLLLGTSVMNLGKLGSDNDTHSKGKSMLGTAVGTAILLVLGMCLIAMIMAGVL